MTETRPERAADDGHAANTLTLPGRHRVVHGRDRIRFVMRGVGQALITAGVILLLFVVYELWVTNLFAHQKQVRVHTVLEQQWAQGDDPLVGRLNLPGPSAIDDPGWAGNRQPLCATPRIRLSVHDRARRRRRVPRGGPGALSDTQLPGQVGNFAVAGHRVGKGEPFLNLDQLRAGDPVVIETKSTWFVYRVLGDVATGDPTVAGVDGVLGRQIVAPSDVAVIDPVPGRPVRDRPSC